jgi:hypothetical protein
MVHDWLWLGKVLAPLSHPTWGKLHCWFCLKLLKICWFVLWWFTCNITDSSASHSFKTRPRGSTWDLANPGLEPSRVEEKTREGKTRCHPVGWPGKTRSRPGCKPVDFCFFVFFLKRRRFDLKKRTDPANLVTRSKPGTRALDRARS